jgi:aminoglycoside phosphotransferase (APT) family kinase protein
MYYERIKDKLEGDLRVFSREFWSRSRYPILPYDPNMNVLIHSDLSMEHVLFTNGINGVIDWGDVGIGNPIWDFVGLWMWGGDNILLSAIKQYTIADLSPYLSTIRFLGICSAFGEMEYRYSKSSQNHIKFGQTALRYALNSFDLM